MRDLGAQDSNAWDQALVGSLTPCPHFMALNRLGIVPWES